MARLTKIVDLNHSWRTKPRIDATCVIHDAQLTQPDLASNWANARFAETCESPEGAFYYAEIGDINRIGNIGPMDMPRVLREGENPFDVSDDKEVQRRLSKIREGKIAHSADRCILVPKTRPNLGKYAFWIPTRNLFYTTDLIELRPAQNILENTPSYEIAVAALYLLIRNPLRPWLIAQARWGKSYPTLTPDDIMNSYLDRDLIERHLIANSTLVNKAIKLAEFLKRQYDINREIEQLVL